MLAEAGKSFQRKVSDDRCAFAVDLLDGLRRVIRKAALIGVALSSGGLEPYCQPLGELEGRRAHELQPRLEVQFLGDEGRMHPSGNR